MSAWWRPDRESAFSVGLSIYSDELRWERLAFLAENFGADWGELRPLPSRDPDLVGTNLDIHLLDTRPESASTNIIKASHVLDSETIAGLRATDPDITISIHAKQDLPDVGAIPNVRLSRDAVRALAINEYFDIDQLGAGGYPVARWLMHPWHSRRFGERSTQRMKISTERDDGHALDLAVDPDFGADVGAIIEWRGHNPGQPRNVTFEQVITIPGEQGIGIFFDRELLQALAELDAPVELRFLTRFRHPRSQKTAARLTSRS